MLCARQGPAAVGVCDHDGEAADGTEKGVVNPVGPGKAGGVSDSRWGVGALTGAAGRASESGERAACREVWGAGQGEPRAAGLQEGHVSSVTISCRPARRSPYTSSRPTLSSRSVPVGMFSIIFLHEILMEGNVRASRWICHSHSLLNPSEFRWINKKSHAFVYRPDFFFFF